MIAHNKQQKVAPRLRKTEIRKKTVLAWLLITLFVSLITTPITSFAESMRQTTDFYVSVTGDDAGNGRSPQTPFATIQHAYKQAQPGDVIHLAPGSYYQDIQSVRDGSPNAPITLTGPADAIIFGGGRGRVFEINHSYHTLQGFKIDGLHGDPNSRDGYRSKLLYVHGKQTRAGVMGLKVLNMAFANSGGEAVRLRYFVQNSEIANSTFINNGVYDFKFNNGGKNGEAIYVGTSSKQWDDGKNPTADPDESNNNWIHHNSFNTLGNECVDIKEGATANIVEYNNCFGQKDSKSGGLDVRGDGNTLRYNQVHGNIGAGVRLGGHLVDGHQYGRHNHVYGNQIYDNLGGGIKFQETPQGDICGNDAYNNDQGNETGTYRDSFNITAPCSPNPTETPPPSPTSTPPPDAPPPSTPTATPEPPSGNTVHQFHEGNNWLEAEAFTNNNVGQWVVHSDDNQASAHRYMLLDTDDNQQEDDVMAYAFKIDYTGEIYVWYRGIRAPGSDRGIFLQLDDGPLVKATVDHETWGWHLDSDTDEWSIEPGEHVLRIYNRRKQVKIDALLITTDPDMDPANFEPYTLFMPVINN